MEIQVDINNPDDSNRFLRALWAEFRKECGKCAWQYTPFKIGQLKTIFIGFADINRPEGNLGVSVTYVQRGTIRSISFKHEPDRPISMELGALLQRTVKFALERMGSPERQLYSVKIEGLYASPSNCVGDFFSFTPISRRRFELTLAVNAFDKTDAKTEFIEKMRQVLNVLSVESNAAFWPLNNEQIEDDEPLPQSGHEGEVYAEDQDWIDDCPERDGQILISRAGKKLIDVLIADRPVPEDVGTFLRACNHFHIARKYAAQRLDLVEFGEAERVRTNEIVLPIKVRNRRLEAAGQVGDAHAEISGALFMSAMEVAAKIGQPPPEACNDCGQLKYRISRRVTDLMQNCGGDNLSRVAKGYYSQRSQYLHEGTMLSPSNYTGTSIPQLDASSPTGCLMQTASPDPNLRDYVGFCLRKVMKEVVNAIADSSD